MARYYFDIRDNGELAVDEQGLEPASLQTVQVEAARSLADTARHAVYERAETIFGHRMAVEMRGNNGPALQPKFSFELESISIRRPLGGADV